MQKFMQNNIIGLSVLFLLYLTAFGQESNKQNDSASADTSQTAIKLPVTALEQPHSFPNKVAKQKNVKTEPLKPADSPQNVDKSGFDKGAIIDSLEAHNLLDNLYKMKLRELEFERSMALSRQSQYDSLVNTLTFYTALFNILILLIVTVGAIFGFTNWMKLKKDMKSTLEEKVSKLHTDHIKTTVEELFKDRFDKVEAVSESLGQTEKVVLKSGEEIEVFVKKDSEIKSPKTIKHKNLFD